MKTIFIAVMFFVLLIAVPLLQSFIFTQETSGKIEINQRIDAPYLKNTGDKNFELMFFGYVGCVKVCTPILHQLDNFYDSAQFAPLKPYVGFSFVNLMPELEPDQPDMFAKTFNADFKGIYLTQKELMRIDRQFSLFFSKSIVNPGEIDHSDYLYLLQWQRNGTLVLKNIYSTHPLNKDAIITDIRTFKKEMK